MVDALLSFPQVQDRLAGISRCTLARWIKAGRFPQPIKVGPRRVAWRTLDVDAWLADQDSDAVAPERVPR